MARLTWRLAAALALVSAVSPLRLAATQETIEPDVKAAFIYNFTKFVEWPPSAISPERFRLCSVGDPKVAAALAAIIEGESAAGRPLALAQPQTDDEARQCQILYISAGDPDRSARLLAAVRQAPVLTAGDGPRFAQQGGAVGFLLEDNRVRFDINMSAVERAGLKVSSKLLRIARHIHGARS
jgi:hypothetical protein